MDKSVTWFHSGLIPFLKERKKKREKKENSENKELKINLMGCRHQVQWGWRCGGSANAFAQAFLRQTLSRFGRQCGKVIIHLVSEVRLAGFKSHLSC